MKPNVVKSSKTILGETSSHIGKFQFFSIFSLAMTAGMSLDAKSIEWINTLGIMLLKLFQNSFLENL